MNYSTAVFLINDDVRAIACTYEADEKAKREIFKTLDKSIAKDDFVVVPTDTRHKMTVVKVVEVDVDVDLDSSIPMQWIVGAVERHDYERILKMEDQAIETIKSAEKRKKRDEMRAAIFKDREGMLNGLSLTHLDAAVDEVQAAPAPRPLTPDTEF